MKIFTLIIIASITLYGCSAVEESKASINNVVEEVQNVKEDVKDAQKKVGETINDIQNAGKKIEEAKDAVEQITK